MRDIISYRINRGLPPDVWALWMAAAGLGMLASGCAAEADSTFSVDAGADSAMASDTDSDSDADSDADTDADGDTDSDTPVDSDTGPLVGAYCTYASPCRERRPRPSTLVQAGCVHQDTFDEGKTQRLLSRRSEARYAIEGYRKG
jgi:hypothetical protein